jgi:mRNA-degrading endonuclease RelE of RelBE toxin-antitoxin system
LVNRDDINEITLHRRAEATLEKLGEDDVAVIGTSIERLSRFGISGHIDTSVKKLTAPDPLFVMRAGKMFRIIFRRVDARTLEVMDIVRRDRLEKMFPASAGSR